MCDHREKLLIKFVANVIKVGLWRYDIHPPPKVCTIVLPTHTFWREGRLRLRPRLLNLRPKGDRRHGRVESQECGRGNGAPALQLLATPLSFHSLSFQSSPVPMKSLKVNSIRFLFSILCGRNVSESGARSGVDERRLFAAHAPAPLM